ncbi:MAG TPA: transporter, partial [Thermoanaerobaculia bacterium]|nr:transporter [Thermoanaerobaculia bacterium]
MRLLAPLLLLSLCAACLYAQSSAERGEPPPIQDNSFLMEEAYNQEPGVVQHINTFQRLRGGPWVATFTQEWPVPGQAHQLSYAIAWQRVEGQAGRRTGLGDVAVNYRYQLVGSGEAKLAIAPRLSVLLSTGDESKALGAGATGFQLNVPVSSVLSGKLVAHWNAGATYTPRARNA